MGERKQKEGNTSNEGLPSKCEKHVDLCDKTKRKESAFQLCTNEKEGFAILKYCSGLCAYAESKSTLSANVLRNFQ